MRPQPPGTTRTQVVSTPGKNIFLAVSWLLGSVRWLYDSLCYHFGENSLENVSPREIHT